MNDLKLEKLEISKESLQVAISEVDRLIAVHTAMKQHLVALLGLGTRARDDGVVRSTSTRGRRASADTLRATIIKVLAKTNKPMRPVDLRNKVIASGYRTSATPSSLYTACFNMASGAPEIAKTKDGFMLKRPKATKQVVAKMPTPPKKQTDKPKEKKA